MNGRASVAYRENKHVYLPKFEPAKPVVAKPPAASGSAPAAAPEGAVKLAVSAPGAKPAAMAPAPGSWSARLNPMTRLRREPASPARPVTAVQTELTLDTVKVVHNDLSDADVEVVPLKSRPARPAGVAEPGFAWSELNTGLFEANVV